MYVCFSLEFLLLVNVHTAAARLNEGVDFGKLRIYGLLTDLIDFHFYSYNPLTNRFAFDETLVVNITRDVSFTDMIPGICLFLHTCLTIDQTHLVANKIFSVILTAYIDGLEATLKRSNDRIKEGDVSVHFSLAFWMVFITFVVFVSRLRAYPTNVGFIQIRSTK